MIFDRYANLKYKYGNRHFWCQSYYVDTVGKNKKVIEEYIKEQCRLTASNNEGFYKNGFWDGVKMMLEAF